MATKRIEPFLCPICSGGTVVCARVPYEVPFRDRTQVVPDAEVMQCESCKEVFLAPGQSDVLQRRAADAVRVEMGLLTGGEITDFRKTLGLTQAQLEKTLGVPAKTVARWEIGTVLQSCAADRFVRVLMAHPELVAELLAEDNRAVKNRAKVA